MASKFRRIVLDVLKPYDPEIHLISSSLLEGNSSIKGLNITVYEMDRMTQKIKVILEGDDLDYAGILEILESQNCVVHSVDQIVAGDIVVEDVEVPGQN